jgi:hypothetical protein
MRTAEDFGFHVATLQHVLEGYKIRRRDCRARRRCLYLLRLVGLQDGGLRCIPYNAALMTQRGVVVSINSDSGEEMRHLNQEAGKSVRRAAWILSARSRW